MILVGISGGIGHGKTTFAAYLADHAADSAHWESSELIIAVANALRTANVSQPNPDDLPSINHWLSALPAILGQEVHCQVTIGQIELTAERLESTPLHYTKLFDYLSLTANRPDLRTNLIDATNKSEFRNILQWLGGYLVKAVGDGVWFDEIVRRIRARSELELATVGGLRFPGDGKRIHQAGGNIIQIIRPDFAESDKHDLTERERDLILSDITVVNDGSLEQLRVCAQQVFADLRQYNPPTTHAYVTSTISI